MSGDRKRKFILVSEQVRQNAMTYIAEAYDGWEITVSPPRRTLDQNAKLWSMLSDVANARPEGRQWTPEVWKCAFMHAVGHQVRFAEGLDGSGPFPIGFSSSNLRVSEMSRLIEAIYEYGARHGIVFRETAESGFMEGR